MVKQLTICLLVWCNAMFCNAQPCNTVNSQSETQSIRAQFKDRLANRQFDDTLQTLTQELEQRYEQADCLEEWLKIHIEYFGKERRVSRETANRWLEKNVNSAFRKPITIIEDSLMMMTLIKKGYNETRLSRIPEARRSYESALAIREKHQLGDPNWMATILYKSLGSIYTRLGDVDRAILYLTTARDMCSDDYKRLGSIYADLGIAYENQPDSVSLRQYLDGLELKNLLPYHKALFLQKIAQTYAAMGKNQEAIQYVEKCQKLINQFDRFQQEDPRNAYYYEKETQWVFEAGLTEVQAEIYAKTKDSKAKQEFEKAIQFNQKAYDTPHHRQIAKTYIKTGDYYLTINQPNQAINYFQNALQCLLPDFQPQKVTDNPDAAEFDAENSIYFALEGKANALIALDEHLPTVLETYDLILDVEDKLHSHYQFDKAKLELFNESRARNETAIGIAQRLYKRTKDKQYLETAFRFAENSKAAILLESLNRQKAALISGIPDSLIIEDKAFNSVAQRNQQEMAEIRRGDQLSAADSAALVLLEEQQLQIYLDQERLQKHLATTYPEYNKLKYQQPAVSLLKLQEDLIKNNEAFIEYFFGQKNVYAFIATKQGLSCQNLGSSKQLNQQLLDYKKQLSSKRLTDGFANMGFNLYQQLVVPLELPPSIDKLIVVTDGALNYVPLQAFSMAASGKATDYFIHKYLINYTYSADIYYSQLQEPPQKDPGQMLAVAPIQFPGNPKLAALPLTEAFIQHLSQEHKGSFITGPQATKQAFVDAAGDFETLVLATHAEAGREPRIHFYDQSMSLNELYMQRLKASTAVLMACGTADGVLEGGEGVMSLARALRYAGVPSVTSSLWEVSEESSATIITFMLDNLKEGMPKDEALRAAQLKFMTTVSERPWRWAAFIHIGNAFPLKQSSVNWMGMGGLLSAVGVLLGWLLLRRRK